MILTAVSVTPFSRLLIRLPNWVGDVMMALSAIRSLRIAFPEARLIGMARPEHLDLARRIAALDEVMAGPPRRGLGRLPTTLKVIQTLRTMKVDGAVLFASSFEAALTVRLAGVPIRVGHSTDHRSILLNRVVRPRDGHYTDRFSDLVVGLGAEPADSGGELELLEADRAFAGRLFETVACGADARPVFVNPASAKTPRAWASGRFRQLAERIAERYPGTPVLVHDRHPFDKPEGWPSSDSIRLVSNVSLTELAGVIDRCSLYVGNDSGPIHIAAALGVPTIGIYGPTSSERTSPRGTRGAVHVPVSASFECSPCRERFFEECPSPPTLDRRPPCLNAVSVETVVDAVGHLLENPRRTTFRDSRPTTHDPRPTTLNHSLERLQFFP